MGIAVLVSLTGTTAGAAELWAGAAKVDITNRDVELVNDSLYVKALVIGNSSTRAVIITVDAVAIGEIGTIRNDYLANVRAQLQRDLGLNPAHVLINASHCHGVVVPDVEQRTVQAVKEAWRSLVPVNVGAGTGYEDRIMENRRLRLKNGREADVRHAYAMPPDEAVGAVGPVDPEIGLLRLDRKDGRTLAVVYNFAFHPIQGAANGGNTADITGFASQVIENNLGDGAVALFLQGCGGDINPVLYKDVANPRDAEPLGNILGLSTLQAYRKIRPRDGGELKLINETVSLPRSDNAARIAEMEVERIQLVESLRGTTLNLKTFMELSVRHGLHEEFPGYYSHRYLHERMLGRGHLARLDAENRKAMEAYLRNVYAMEELTRLQTNLALMKKHQARNQAAGKTIEVEVVGLRVGDFVLVSHPGEATVQIGLNLKQRSPHDLTFVSAYSNGYIYYTPTAEQLRNVGRAQEDSDCLVAPEWQQIYEDKALDILRRL